MRRLPNQLIIGGVRVPITQESDLKSDAGGHGLYSAYGEYDPDNPSIKLEREMGSERRKLTLMHEGLHGVFNAANIILDHEDEEMLVGRLGPQLLNFIRSNKAAIAYMQEV